MIARISIVLPALTLALGLSVSPASASQPQNQTIRGTLHIDANGCANPCQFTASGPFAGTAALENLEDRANRGFSVSHDLYRLSTSATDSITIKTMTRTAPSTSTDPCHVDFQEQGTWQIVTGSGVNHDLQGEGTLNTHGLAVNHDPSCAQDPPPYSEVTYQLNGRAHHQTH